MQKVAITTEYIKLDSFLKLAGATDSGGQSKVVIKDGEIKVGDEVCTMRGKKLYPGAVVEAFGKKYQVVAGE